MKVGFLKTSPPTGNRGSGVSTYLSELLPALSKHGVEGSVFWTEGSGAGTPSRPYQKPRSAWPRYQSIHWPNPRLMVSLSEWVAREHIDYIHCHWAVDEMLALLRDLPPSFPPVIVSFHTFEPVCPLKTHVTHKGRLCDQVPGFVCVREGCRTPWKWALHDIPLHRLRRKASSGSALYLVHNQELVSFVKRAGYYPVRQLSLGIARESPAVPNPHPRPPILLFAGRLRPEKGVATLMGALEDVFRAVPDAEVRFAGSGPEAQSLQQAAAQFGSRVKFLGALRREDLNREFGQARALVMPSLWKENFGLVGVEAMAFGTPVIAPMVGGIRDWLQPGVNGLAFERGSVESLAAQAIEILSDPTLAARLAPGALATAEQYSMDSHAQALAAIYREMPDR